MAETSRIIEVLQKSLSEEEAISAKLRARLATAREDTLDECIKATCRECRRGDEPRYDAEVKYYYHDVAEGAELGCSASAIRALKDAPHG